MPPSVHRKSPRHLRTLVALTSLIVATLAISAPGATAASDQRDAAQQHREAILDYWTPERVRTAVPRLPVLDGIPAHHRPGHAGGPGGGGGDGDDGGGDDGGGDTTVVVTGALWTGASTEGNVAATTGKVLFTMNGTNYVCSGSTVTPSQGSSSLVLTAGHCVHNGDNRTASWASNWMFIPAYHNGGTFTTCDQTTYGCWTAANLTTTSSWYASGNFDDDAGFAVMGDGGKPASAPVDLIATVGSHGISFAGEVGEQTHVHAFGYPAAKKYNGRDLVYCAGTTREGGFGSTTTAGLSCGMTGGSSGGPWYSGFKDGTPGTAVSVNSHGFRLIKDVMFGPVFGPAEKAAYDRASGKTSTGAESRPN